MLIEGYQTHHQNGLRLLQSIPDFSEKNVTYTLFAQINAPSAKAKNGEYPIVKIKKRGYAWHPVRKEWRIANLVEHEHMIYDDEEMDAPELEPEEEVS